MEDIDLAKQILKQYHQEHLWNFWEELTEEEKQETAGELKKILAYMEKLEELDTDGVEPMSHVFPVQNVFREDIVEREDQREALLENAPQKKEGQYLVPKTV